MTDLAEHEVYSNHIGGHCAGQLDGSHQMETNVQSGLRNHQPKRPTIPNRARSSALPNTGQAKHSGNTDRQNPGTTKARFAQVQGQEPHTCVFAHTCFSRSRPGCAPALTSDLPCPCSLSRRECQESHVCLGKGRCRTSPRSSPDVQLFPGGHGVPITNTGSLIENCRVSAQLVSLSPRLPAIYFPPLVKKMKVAVTKERFLC